MKLLLRSDVDGVGKRGDIVDVAAGFARNSLIPKGYAIKASPGVEKQLLYIAVTDAGVQETLTYEEFSKKYGWKNDPEKVKLLDN